MEGGGVDSLVVPNQKKHINTQKSGHTFGWLRGAFLEHSPKRTVPVLFGQTGQDQLVFLLKHPQQWAPSQKRNSPRRASGKIQRPATASPSLPPVGPARSESCATSAGSSSAKRGGSNMAGQERLQLGSPG